MSEASASENNPAEGGSAPNQTRYEANRYSVNDAGPTKDGFGARLWSGTKAVAGFGTAAVVGAVLASMWWVSQQPDTSRDPETKTQTGGPEACEVIDDGIDADCAKDSGFDFESAPARTELDPAIYDGPRNSWTVNRVEGHSATPTDIGIVLS